MRIIQVCAVDFTAVHMLRPLMEACRTAGWDVEFACADGPGVTVLKAEGFHYRPVAITRRVDPLKLTAGIVELARSLRSDPPNIVHTHTPVGGLVGRSAAVLAGRGSIVHTFHGLPFASERLSIGERAFLQVERSLARRTRLFFSQARGDAERAARLGVARWNDTVVIGNGVDIRKFAPDPTARAIMREQMRIESHMVVVLCVARLVREKGVLDLASAALDLRADESLRFVLVGSSLPSDRSDVTAALAAHPVRTALGDRWQQLGERKDVASLMKAVDIFVLPSYREGLPRSLIEAMASGLPSVATDIPGCRELIEGGSGSLVPVGDPRRLAEAIRSLRSDAAKRSEMGAAARRLAALRHDERHVLDVQLRALAELH